MKKTIAAALVLLTVLLAFASCTKPQAPLTIDIEKLAKDLSGVSYVEQLEALDPSVVTTLYGFTSGAKNVIVYGASGATPEEIIIAEYEDENTAKSAVEKFEKRLSSQKTTFDDYNAEYRPLLDTPVLQQAGRYIVYCVSNDHAAAQAVLDGYLK